MTPLIFLDDVTKIYGEGSVAVQALVHIDLKVERGAFAAVVGPSGSGKTTMLNIISGLDRATSGRVELDGTDITGLSKGELSKLRLKYIGFVFQGYNLLPVLTAYENAEYVLMLQGVPTAERKERVMSLLQRVGLSGMENRFPRELSGGQQQRVALARAVAAEPALVLADEPTANVDSKTGGALLDLLSELNAEKGTTFLMSSHDRTVIERARELIVLQDGIVVYHGDAKGLRESESAPKQVNRP